MIDESRPQLSWTRSDPEQRLGFRGGRFTGVKTYSALLIAGVLTTVFYLALIPVNDSYLAGMFLRRGFVPYLIVGLFFWSLVILVFKLLKLRLQRKTLAISIVPDDPEFVLSPATVDDVNRRMYEALDDPKQFVLFNRIAIALANLRNLGRVADVDEILATQAEHDESVMETSYSLVHGFVWAIPVLGFIGTVLGLSQAIGGFGSVLATADDLSQIRGSLQEVTGGLAVAFETTLEGLLGALLIQLLLTAVKKSEEEFLDSCSEYCVRNIVGRLRLMPFESGEAPSGALAQAGYGPHAEP